MSTPCSSSGSASTSLNRCMSSEFLREALAFSLLSPLIRKSTEVARASASLFIVSAGGCTSFVS